MDSPAVQFPIDPAASPEAPRGAEPAPGKRRGEKTESSGSADAAAAVLTVPFAEILKSKRLDIKTGSEDRDKKESLPKAKQAGLKAGGETPDRAEGRFAAAVKPLRMPAVEVQANETLEHAKELSGQAMKAAASKVPSREDANALSVSRPSDKGTLSPTEEALLKEMVQKNGNVTTQKKAAQMTGYVNGEPLNRREGINAVKSMTAKEGAVLEILSGDEGAQAQSKEKTAKPAKTRQAVVMRDTASEGTGKSSLAALSSGRARQETDGPYELAQDRPAQPVPGKKQGGASWSNPELRDVPAGTSATSILQGRGIDNPTPARPQAVMSQVIDGAAQILRDGSGRMVLTLQPPRLGTLDLDVVVQDNRVRMVMLADNQEVKQMLQAAMDDLRNALQDKGFEIDRLEVLVQNRSEEGGSDFWREAGFAGGGSRKEEGRKPEQDAGPAVQESPVRHLRAGDSGLSVFA